VRYRQVTIEGMVISALVLLVLLGLIGTIGYAIWWHSTYKCVEDERYDCETLTCSFYDADMNCVAWYNQPSTCSRCVAWRKR